MDAGDESRDEEDWEEGEADNLDEEECVGEQNEGWLAGFHEFDDPEARYLACRAVATRKTPFHARTTAVAAVSES